MKSITFLALLLAPVSAVAISFSGDKAAASHQIQLKLGNDICSAVAVRANCVLTVGHCAGGGTAWRQAYTDPSGAANPVPNSIVGNISQSEVIHMGPVDGVVVMRIHRNIVGAGDVAQIAGSPLPNGSSVTVNGNGLNEYGRAHVSNASFRDSLDFINTPGGGPFYSVKSTQQGGRYMEIKGGDSGAGAFAGGKLQGVICTSGTSAGQPAASIIDISRNKAEVEATIKRVCEDPLPGGNPITCSITVQQTTVNQGGDINFTLSGTGPIAYATVTKPTASGAPDVIRIDPYRGAYQGSVKALSPLPTHLLANVYTVTGMSASCSSKMVRVVTAPPPPPAPACEITVNPNPAQHRQQATATLRVTEGHATVGEFMGVRVALQNGRYTVAADTSTVGIFEYTGKVINAQGVSSAACKVRYEVKGAATPTPTPSPNPTPTPTPNPPQPPPGPTACSGVRQFLFGAQTSTTFALSCLLRGFTLSAPLSCAPTLNWALTRTVPASGITAGPAVPTGSNLVQSFNVSGTASSHSSLSLGFLPNGKSCPITVTLR